MIISILIVGSYISVCIWQVNILAGPLDTIAAKTAPGVAEAHCVTRGVLHFCSLMKLWELDEAMRREQRKKEMSFFFK